MTDCANSVSFESRDYTRDPISDRQLNIYIVEDEALLAMCLQQSINNLGHRVSGIAASFEQAIQALNIIKVDLVITDILLKGPKTGIDLGNYINDNLKIPFIYQSSVKDKSIIKEALKTSPIGYLTKPVLEESLRSTIGKLF